MTRFSGRGQGEASLQSQGVNLGQSQPLMPVVVLGASCDSVIATEIRRSSWRNVLPLKKWCESCVFWALEKCAHGGAAVITGQPCGSSPRSEDGRAERGAQVPHDVVNCASRPPGT